MLGRYSLLNPPLPPMSKQMLHAVYFLSSNRNLLLSFQAFESLYPSYDCNKNIATLIHRVRPILEVYGLTVVNHRNIGYMCVSLDERMKR